MMYSPPLHRNCQQCAVGSYHPRMVRDLFANLQRAVARGDPRPESLVPNPWRIDYLNEVLAWAACRGDCAVVRATYCGDYDTALICASHHGHVDIVRCLRNDLPSRWCRASPTAHDCEALLVAARGGHQETVEELLDWIAAHSSDGDLEHLELWRAAHEAVAGGHWHLFTVIRSRMEDVFFLDCHLSRAFITAAAFGRVTIMQHLHKEEDVRCHHTGADDVYAALAAASRDGHLAVVRWLAGQATDVFDVHHDDIAMAINTAILRGHDAIADFVFETCCGLVRLRRQHVNPSTRLLHTAAFAGCAAVVRWLCERPRRQRGVRGSAGRNGALVNAARGGHLSIVRYLCELPTTHGVRACAQNNAALTIAVCSNHDDMVRYLCALPLAWHQVDPAHDDNGPLWHACNAEAAGFPSVLRTLLTLPASRGVDPTARRGVLLVKLLGGQRWQLHAAQWLWESPPMQARSADGAIGRVMNGLAAVLLRKMSLWSPHVATAAWAAFARWLRAWPGAETWMDVTDEASHPFTFAHLRHLASRAAHVGGACRDALAQVQLRRRWRRRRTVLLLRVLRDMKRADAAVHRSCRAMPDL